MANELKLRDHLHGDLAVAALQELSQIMQKWGDKHAIRTIWQDWNLITTATDESSYHHKLGRRLA